MVQDRLASRLGYTARTTLSIPTQQQLAIMSTGTGTGWAQLRQQARSLETQVRVINAIAQASADHMQTETLFHTYSQFAAVPNIPPRPSEDERQTEAKIHDILDKVGQSCLFRTI